MRVAPAVALALVLLACVTDPDPNPCVGSFDGTASGSGTANKAISGCSVYSTKGSFTLFMKDGHNGIMVVSTGATARPAVGTHALGVWNTAPLSASYSSSSTNKVFFTGSGTLTITESTPGNLKGSLTMSVSEHIANAITATVTANFTASCAPKGANIC